MQYRKPRNEEELADFYKICEKERLSSDGSKYERVGKQIKTRNFNSYSKNSILVINGKEVVGGLQYSPYEMGLHIDLLAVKKEFRKREIGKNLIKILVQKTDEETYSLAPVSGSKIFYQKVGFEKDKKTPFFVLKIKKSSRILE